MEEQIMAIRSLLIMAFAMLLTVGCASDGRTAGDRLDDAAITARANAALAGSPVASAWEVSVESHDGTVLLSGFVETEEERAEAERIVAQVDGVEEVRNHIELRPERATRRQ
jgi:hyperosmotically inducible periplasmic protein